MEPVERPSKTVGHLSCEPDRADERLDDIRTESDQQVGRRDVVQRDVADPVKGLMDSANRTMAEEFEFGESFDTSLPGESVYQAVECAGGASREVIVISPPLI